MINNNLTSKDFFTGLIILYVAVILGQLLFVVIIFFMAHNGSVITGLAYIKDTLLYVISILSVVCIVGSHKIFKFRLDRIDDNGTLKAKLENYRSALMMRYAILDFASFTGIVFFMLTNDLLFLISTGLIILIFLLIKPSKEQTFEDLRLSEVEIMRLNNSHELIT